MQSIMLQRIALIAFAFLLALPTVIMAGDIETVDFTARGVVNDNGLRIRNKPGLKGDVVGHLNKGDLVSIQKRSKLPEQIGNITSYWYYVVSGAKKGYCFAYYIDLDYSTIATDWDMDGMIKDIIVSSYYVSEENKNIAYPSMMFVSSGSFAWIPASNGAGEYIEVIMGTPIETNTFTFRIGFADPKIFLLYNRVKKLTLQLGDEKFPFSFPDENKLSYLDLPRKVKFTNWRITINEVHKGSKYNLTPLSHVKIPGRMWLEPVRDLFTNPGGLKIGVFTDYPASFISYFFEDGTYVNAGGTIYGWGKTVGTWKYNPETREITITCTWKMDKQTDQTPNVVTIDEKYFSQKTILSSEVFPSFFGKKGPDDYTVNRIEIEDEKEKQKKME